MEEFLKIDSFLKVITESRHNIVDFINSDVQDQNATDLEAESIDSIERNIKKWEAVSAFPSTTFPSTTFPSEFPSTLPMIYH